MDELRNSIRSYKQRQTAKNSHISHMHRFGSDEVFDGFDFGEDDQDDLSNVINIFKLHCLVKRM